MIKFSVNLNRRVFVMFPKLDMCNDNEEMLFRIAYGKVSSILYRIICRDTIMAGKTRFMCFYEIYFET